MPVKKEDILTKAQLLNQLQLEMHKIDIAYIIELNNEGLTDIELKARANELEIPYTRWIKKVIDTFTVAQMLAIAEKGTPEDLAFMRGSISAFALLQSWFQSQLSLSKARFQNEE